MAQARDREEGGYTRANAPSHRNEMELENTRGQPAKREQIVLEPTDGGYHAWFLLVGCFIINVLIWGT